MVTVSSWSRVMPKNGPPEQVRISRRISLLLPAAHEGTERWRSARSPPGRSPRRTVSASAITSSPAHTSVSLLAKADALFRPDGGEGGPQTDHANHGGDDACPPPPRTAASIRPASPKLTRIGSACQSFTPVPERPPEFAITASFGRKLPALLRPSAPRSVPAVSAATRMPGRRRITSRVCRPMEPVEPRMLTYCHHRPRSSHRHGKQQEQYFHQPGATRISAVKPIQHAAVAGNQIAVILDAGLPLDDGEAQVAENGASREPTKPYSSARP